MELYGHTCCCCKREGCETREPLEGIIRTKPEITYNTNRFHPNGKKAPDGIEIRFGMTRPTAEVRDMLKAHGFKFSEKQTIWYAVDNAKSRELADFLTANEIEADDTQYEKRSFWAKIGTKDFFDKLSNYTEFMIAGEPPQFFRTKKQLLSKVSNPVGLAMSGALKFKKFYNKPVGEEGVEGEPDENEEENEDQPEEESESEEGESEEESTTTKPGSADLDLGDKLHSLALGMQKKIDSKINSATSQQRPTPKRLRVAAEMRKEGLYLRKIQGILLCLAAAHKTGLIKNFQFLPNIRSKAQIETLLRSQDSEGGFYTMEHITRIFQHYKSSLSSLGINDAADWVNATNEATSLVEGFGDVFNQNTEAERKNEKIREMEMKVRSMKIPGFFPTPKDLIAKMLEWAQLKENDAILEPSAGKGDILDAIRKHFQDAEPNAEPDLDAIELNSSLREILALKGYNVIGTDFLSYDDTAYDKIVMNPPFENGLDIDHVTHAFDLLKYGGRLVAIVSEGPFFRKFKKDSDFREWLSEKNAYVSQPIKEAFKNSFNSTGVNVRMIVINEDGTHPEIDEEEESSQPQPHNDGEDLELLELEAQAEAELLKLKLEAERKRKGLNGLDEINHQKLKQLEQQAMEIDLPALWDFK
ncbi:MAG: hypothetical protein ACXVP0_06410 [Bacteroidia bacterium]